MTSLVPTSAFAKASADQSEDTVIYECCVLYPANLSQKEEQTLLKGIEEIFAEAEGRQIAKDAWGRRGLAYPIKKQTEGNFLVLYYEMDPTKMREVDRQLRILPNVLRHLMVKPPKGYELVKYSEAFEQWQKDKVTAVETKRKEEETKLQRKVVEKAKRDAKRTEVKKAEVKKKEIPSTLEEADLSKKLDELISDDTLGL
ncbi:MAG: 30S ribosomal protein S6 [Candidatus Peribacteraceae bacterium]|jgi:small subunit ribosomal protein S6|nr:30S ribosomal protein S6 [Candidatus Peribacteraceae bacterium]